MLERQVAPTCAYWRCTDWGDFYRPIWPLRWTINNLSMIQAVDILMLIAVSDYADGYMAGIRIGHHRDLHMKVKYQMRLLVVLILLCNILSA